MNNDDLEAQRCLIINYLDTRYKTVELACKTGQTVSDAIYPEKLKVFDDGIARLITVACELASDAFARYVESAQRAGILSPGDWAEHQVREFLEERLGHQLRYEKEEIYEGGPIGPPYLWRGEFPHKAIISWFTQAASQESLILPAESLPDDRTPLEILRDVDVQLVESSYRAPGWLRRWRDNSDKRKEPQIEPLSWRETREEMGFLQTELWSELERAIESAKSLFHATHYVKVRPNVWKLTFPDFNHSPDFCTVNNKGTEYTFTKDQAQVVRLLFEAAQAGTPTLRGETILGQLQSNSQRIRDIFRSNPKAWKELIVAGEKRGTFRLNL
jgi:hypothetical protein